METRRLKFPKSERVREKSEIDRIFRKGARFSCKGMVARIAPADPDMSSGSRVVFVPVRAFKGAVQRNRAKRCAREAWRLERPRIVDGFDVAFVLYPGCDSLAECSASMRYLLRKAGLMR